MISMFKTSGSRRLGIPRLSSATWGGNTNNNGISENFSIVCPHSLRFALRHVQKCENDDTHLICQSIILQDILGPAKKKLWTKYQRQNKLLYFAKYNTFSDVVKYTSWVVQFQPKRGKVDEVWSEVVDYGTKGESVLEEARHDYQDRFPHSHNQYHSRHHHRLATLWHYDDWW